MAVIDDFTDAFRAVGFAVLNPDEALMAYSRKTYLGQRWVNGGKASGKGWEHFFDSGAEIGDDIHLTPSTSAQDYGIGTEWDYGNVQTTQRWSVRMRYMYNSVTIFDEELDSQVDGRFSVDHRVAQFKKFRDLKFGPMWERIAVKTEEDCWRQPDHANMEAATGLAPLSIPCGVNEFANGTPVGWTGANFQGVSAATFSNWRPPTIKTYSQQANTNWDLWPAMGSLCREVYKSQLPYHEEYSDPKSSPWFWATSDKGMQEVERGILMLGDNLVTIGRQDPNMGMPSYKQIPIIYVQDLDTAAIHPASTATAFGTEMASATDNRGPRFQLFDGRFGGPIFHKKRFMDVMEPIRPEKQPTARIYPVRCYRAFVVRDRKRFGGIVRPSGAVYTS